ncbi:MAG TPA: dephospho-CoA kinase, partial [Thermoguttaceae bacterium]
MKIIGLLGGIASGKSMVAGQFARCGAKVLDADQIGHEVLRRPEIEAAVRERWGDKVFDADGRIDRRRLAQIVFGPLPDGPRERKCLEELTHPVIISVIKQELRTFAESGEKAVVLDAALLEEAGLDRLCDQLIYVDAPPTVRLQRALARGWREEDFAA